MTADKDGLFFQMVVALNNTDLTARNCKLGVVLNSAANLGGSASVGEFTFSTSSGDDVAVSFYHIQGQISRVSATTVRAHVTMLASQNRIVGSPFFASPIDAGSSQICESVVNITVPTFAGNSFLIPFSEAPSANDFSLIFFSVWGLKKV
jgi:hypothetical protein